MARFDVYSYSTAVPFVLDVQADILSDLQTRVVVPLIPCAQADDEKTDRLKPVLAIDGADYLLMTTELGPVNRSSLGDPITNIEDLHRQRITAALDFLFQGF